MAALFSPATSMTTGALTGVSGNNWLTGARTSMDTVLGLRLTEWALGDCHSLFKLWSPGPLRARLLQALHEALHRDRVQTQLVNTAGFREVAHTWGWGLGSREGQLWGLACLSGGGAMGAAPREERGSTWKSGPARWPPSWMATGRACRTAEGAGKGQRTAEGQGTCIPPYRHVSLP